MRAYVLGLIFKYNNDVRDGQEITQISGAGFLDFVKLLLTILFAFIFHIVELCMLDSNNHLTLLEDIKNRIIHFIKGLTWIGCVNYDMSDVLNEWMRIEQIIKMNRGRYTCVSECIHWVRCSTRPLVNVIVGKSGPITDVIVGWCGPLTDVIVGWCGPVMDVTVGETLGPVFD